MKKMGDTNVASMNTSLIKQGGKQIQHLVQDAVLRSIQTGDESSKKQLLVLAALFQQLLNNTNSPDVRWLAMMAAVGSVEGVIDPQEALEIAKRLMSVRQGQVIDSMF